LKVLPKACRRRFDRKTVFDLSGLSGTQNPARMYAVLKMLESEIQLLEDGRSLILASNWGDSQSVLRSLKSHLTPDSQAKLGRLQVQFFGQKRLDYSGLFARFQQTLSVLTDDQNRWSQDDARVQLLEVPNPWNSSWKASFGIYKLSTPSKSKPNPSF